MRTLTILIICAIFVSLDCSENRVRRQSDSTTEVIGLVMQNGATAEDYLRLKRAIKGMRKRVRGKRAIFHILKTGEATNNVTTSTTSPSVYTSNHHDIAANAIREAEDRLVNTYTQLEKLAENIRYTLKILESAESELTQAQSDLQSLYNQINHDFRMAISLKNSESIRMSPMLRRMVVVNENGVTCNQVCDVPNNGFATIGICTNQYCACNSGRRRAIERRFCQRDFVFDTLGLSCANPSNTVLCSD
ncbi:unnamed protein product [Allacma fusca]|uniref:Uncharacterized protein n=1 Tax=Allacma fusca TaxID=39272 RepID=A0A8J2JFE2_9HEXA|nr:unnamed protein product [Allacma fusca]